EGKARRWRGDEAEVHRPKPPWRGRLIARETKNLQWRARAYFTGSIRDEQRHAGAGLDCRRAAQRSEQEGDPSGRCAHAAPSFESLREGMHPIPRGYPQVMLNVTPERRAPAASSACLTHALVGRHVRFGTLAPHPLCVFTRHRAPGTTSQVERWGG